MKLTAALIVLLTGSCCFHSFAGETPSEDVHARLLPGKKRSLLAYAGASHSFTLEVTKSVKLSDVPGFVTIDKQIVQSTLVPVSRAMDVSQPTSSDRQKEILLKYMNYELSYYRKKLRQNYSHLQTEWITLQGRLFLVWYFDMPENYKLVSKQVYVSTLFFDQVMDLNAPVFKADDWGKARGILVKLAGSMKTFDHRLDLDQLEKKLAKG